MDRKQQRYSGYASRPSASRAMIEAEEPAARLAEALREVLERLRLERLATGRREDAGDAEADPAAPKSSVRLVREPKPPRQ